jgi:hypothetical protein
MASEALAVSADQANGKDLAQGPGWPLWQRIAFRFAFTAFVPYALHTLLVSFMEVGWLEQPYLRGVSAVTGFIGARLLHHPVVPLEMDADSSDTFADWILLGVIALIGVIGAAVWSLAARRRREHRVLFSGMRAAARYLLATQMFYYGGIKLWPIQFESRVPPIALFTRLGTMSRIAILWNFMAASRLYTFVAG